MYEPDRDRLNHFISTLQALCSDEPGADVANGLVCNPISYRAFLHRPLQLRSFTEMHHSMIPAPVYANFRIEFDVSIAVSLHQSFRSPAICMVNQLSSSKSYLPRFLKIAGPGNGELWNARLFGTGRLSRFPERTIGASVPHGSVMMAFRKVTRVSVSVPPPTLADEVFRHGGLVNRSTISASWWRKTVLDSEGCIFWLAECGHATSGIPSQVTFTVVTAHHPIDERQVICPQA
ncbi:hypothetical protein FN846DRAFT_894923 [Sphaerosporella brunnea]|uniref:Uncharacterized protein n=1 Tax=Sphaerosporella brunnea TaxID=1250544 RepID=A0A5J5EFY3_9PEZI|nr:hypothetical protein FN846DRAFT_894923 [Sphaerosporella brunnea]